MKRFYTAEAVTSGHPDKLCDLIADSILDECLKGDSESKVACEVMATKGKIYIAGEITSKQKIYPAEIADRVLESVGYSTEDIEVEVQLHQQSVDIKRAVEKSREKRSGLDKAQKELEYGAGDQGVMIGYACDETSQLMPMPVVLANKIAMELYSAGRTKFIEGLLPDGKVQVTVAYEDEKPVYIDTIVVSCQHREDVNLRKLTNQIKEGILKKIFRILPMEDENRIFINPSGRFVIGGLEADTGLTGGKLMVDTYGSMVSHGGGAFSGKDCTKVDRSGAYMARYIAKNLVVAGLASRCQVSLAYAIGIAKPVMVEIDTFGTGKVCADDCLAEAVKRVFGLTPYEIIKTLRLQRPIYRRTATYGHFGRKEFPWERTDKVQELRDMVM